MPDSQKTMATQTQFSVFLASKPGILAGICQKLASDKINIMAMSMMDSSEHGVLRLVAENPEQVRRSLTEMQVPTTEAAVLLATLPNRPGALADVVEKLSAAHITVNYAYVTAGVRNGKTMGVFRVSDMQKAMNVLSDKRPRRKQPATKRTGIRTQGRRKA